MSTSRAFGQCLGSENRRNYLISLSRSLVQIQYYPPKHVVFSGAYEPRHRGDLERCPAEPLFPSISTMGFPAPRTACRTPISAVDSFTGEIPMDNSETMPQDTPWELLDIVRQLDEAGIGRPLAARRRQKSLPPLSPVQAASVPVARAVVWSG